MGIPKISRAEHQVSVHRQEQLPSGFLPEIAFLGRSNVGKSSLINTLLGRRKLVRVSAKPGCTRALNFYLINGRWYFVDLPGFGYARVSRDLQARWGRLIMEYLEKRKNLHGVVLILDARREPGEEERFLWEFLLSHGRIIIPVLTKADKLKRGERSRTGRRLAQALSPLAVGPEELHWFSALTHEGRDKLWGKVLACLERQKNPNVGKETGLP
jgi:GTP-binding protein